jgi:hypothetical protein
MNQEIDFNLNGTIKVKLLPRAFDIIDARHKVLFGKHAEKFEVIMPKVDEEGWSEFQLWDFCNIFGSELHNGACLVCETNIKIVSKT